MSIGEASGRLADAVSALAAADWGLAYTHAVAIAAAPDASADALDVLAEAAWWVCRLDEGIAARERAYHLYDADGLHRRAGQCATWLYLYHGCKGRPAIATGWLRRARRALDRDTECPEYGYLLLHEAEVAHGNGDLDAALASAERVADLGRSLRNPDLEASALQAIGRILIDRGRPADGLAHLDEAMLFAIEGRLSPFVTGKVYCSLVSACHDLGDLRRANEWIAAVGDWADNHPFAVFPGLCRLHRADLLQWRGEWELAEVEAQRACGELENLFVPNAAVAFAELGEIRRRRGDLAGAEEALARAESLGRRPTVQLARLRLVQGDTATAGRILADALAETTWNRLARAWLLPVEVEVAVALDDFVRARVALEELRATAEHYESPVLLAAAAMAAGRLALADGDPSAPAALRAAVQAWQELDAPYETAVARVLLAEAYRAACDPQSASVCCAEAAAEFRRLGATLDLRSTEQQASPLGFPCGLTAREVEVLRLVAAGCTNKAIAAELFLSDKTVSRHLSNIYTKIGVSSRAAATAFAYANHLTNVR